MTKLPNAQRRSSATAMLLSNTLPLLHLLTACAMLFLPVSWVARIAACVGILYLAPPLLARLIFLRYPFTRTRIGWGEPQFLVWWLMANLQALYVRLGFLEELLRLVPGLYSSWLRLWGARIGARTYWAPGLVILDRSFLRIGDNVVFGAGVRLNAHVIADDEGGAPTLLLADIVIGDHCVIGGYSLLTAGTEICPGEKTRALLISPPFSTWRNGTRVRNRDERSDNE